MIVSGGKGLSLITLQVRAEWTQMSCLSRGESTRQFCRVLMGVVRDGHGEKVQESQKQVHYDYKNRLEEYDAEI